MSNQQLFIAFAMPTAAAMLGIFVTVIGIFFNRQDVKRLEDKMEARFEKVDGRFDRVDGCLDRLTEKVGELSERMAAVEVRVAHLEDKQGLNR